jgi:hypothetical protein
MAFVPHGPVRESWRAGYFRVAAALRTPGPGPYAISVNAGAEYIEFDVRRTADAELAAFHDSHTAGAAR